MSAFQRATKKKAKLRLALFGASGSGKTYTALRIAKGIGGKVAVIDSERGSASKYSDRFDFDVVELDEQRIENYIGYINEAEKAGYEVLIIDSMTHAWQELLQEVEKIAQAQFKGNIWSAWSKGTPKQRSLVDALLNFNGHIIATMRSKTEWVIEQNNGKNKPVRVGMSPEQGKGIEYEFDLLIEITPEHYGNVLKDRTGKYQDKTIEKPDEKFGKELAKWLSDGVEAPKKEEIKAHITTEETVAGFEGEKLRSNDYYALRDGILAATSIEALNNVAKAVKAHEDILSQDELKDLRSQYKTHNNKLVTEAK